MVGSAGDPVGLLARRKQVVAQAVAVGMAADGSDRVNCDQHPWPGHEPARDGVAQADIEHVVRPDVAHRRETGLDGAPGVHGRLDRLLGHLAAHGVDKSLVVIGRALVRQMRMGVDKAGRKRGITQIDDARPVGQTEIGPDRADRLARDDHHAAAHELFRVAVEQPCRLEHDRTAGILLFHTGSLDQKQGAKTHR